MLVVTNRKELDKFLPAHEGLVTDEMALDILKKNINWLNHHNKNYTKEQQWKLWQIEDILRFLVVGGKKKGEKK